MYKLIVLTLVSLILGFAYAEDHGKHHGKAEEERHAIKSLSLNHGKKWIPDQNMKKNMEAIHDQFIKLNLLVSSKKVAMKDYADLSKVISDSAQNIARECKMEPKADETFHVVLGDLLTVSEDLKDAKKVQAATAKLTHAFKIYSDYFDHSFSK